MRPLTKNRCRREEDNERKDHGDEGGGRKQTQRAFTTTGEVGQLHGEHPDRRVIAEKPITTKKSFHTQRNWKMANNTSTGMESGTTRRVKILK